MNKTTKLKNVVPKETLREVQQYVLNDLADTLKQSFGPMGSNTVIKKENAMNIYTKDGHTILKNIYYHGILEQSIKDDIESITRHIVTTVGDGTTSAVMIAAKMFEAISVIADKTNTPPVQVLNAFNRITGEICDRIDSMKWECTVDDIYDITLISTNGNNFIAQSLKDIYNDFGMEVFIDVAPSIGEETSIKYFDGMTINTGIGDNCYITNPSKNEAVVDNPRVYFFKDPIDTKEMAGLLDCILSLNIVKPYNQLTRGENTALVPTVIIAPKISRDLSALMDKITAMMNQLPAGNKLPLIIITDFHQVDEVDDIRIMCGAPTIHKYIDPEIYQHDIESGDAPTPETIQDFCGYCECVKATPSKTSFINPSAKKDENGEFSMTYKNLLNFLETALQNAKDNGDDARVIGTYKRRINSLKSNLVEFNVGGITSSDRDALRDLVEDAVLNCRSAAANGVGYGANYMALRATFGELINLVTKDDNSDEIDNSIDAAVTSAIHSAYCDIVDILYSNSNMPEKDHAYENCLDNECPYNIATNQYDKKVKSSIMSDIIIMETINKIVGLMATANQFIVPSPMHNVYVD